MGKINLLFKEYMNIELTDSNYKIGYYNNLDVDVFFTHYSQGYCLQYNDASNRYILLHRSTKGYDSKKHRMHKEWSLDADTHSIDRVCYMISTRHNPKDIVNKSKLNNLGIIY